MAACASASVASCSSLSLRTKESCSILHDKTHFTATDSTYCAACGQVLKPAPGYGSSNRTSNRIGIAISVLLHVLGLAYYLTRDEPERHAPPPAHEGAMVYVKPLVAKPKSQPQPKTAVAKLKPPPRPKQALASITPPARPKQEVFVPPVVAPMAPPPQQDMAAMIEARRKQRADAQPQAEPEESDEARGQRIARANIAGAQGRSAGSDKNDSGGVFSILNKNYHSADVKFRGWNGNFKRNWSQQVQVEQGAELDIETAIVKKMIELIRKEKPGDFVWDSHRLGRHVNLSARVGDEAELKAFLLKEFFPEYRPYAR